MKIFSNGWFSMSISSKELSKGLRKEVRPVNDNSLAKCQGLIGDTDVLRSLDQVKLFNFFEETFQFPYPQIFILTNMIIVCDATHVWELIDGYLNLQIVVPQGSMWTLVDFHDYVYMSNGRVSVIKDPQSKEYMLSDLPTSMAACNYNGQVLLGSPNAGYYEGVDYE